MHSIIKLHMARKNTPPVYVFIDKITMLKGNHGGEHTKISLAGRYNYIIVEEPLKEVLDLIAAVEAAEANDDRALLSEALDYQKSLSCQPSVK